MIKHLRTFGILLLGLILLTGCNIPGIKTNPTPILFPTPNYTMTALFSKDAEIPPTITPAAAVVTVENTVVIEATATSPEPSKTPVVFTATAEETPTATKMVTSTATTTSRGGDWVYAKYLSTAPTIDGVWDEWDTTQYASNYVVYGSGNWKSKEDLSSSFRVGWNSEYLFIAVKVYDDTYAQKETGQNLYKGDSLEILLDTNLYGDLNYAALSSDDFQIGISPGKNDINGEKEAFLWFPSSKSGGLSNVKIASAKNEGVYRVEAAIPWSVYGITPSSGQQFGFGVSVSDNDLTGENVQQSMVSNLPYRSLVNPTTWTVLTLVK
jgi:hypothetical protein